jgi:hypothetical protein
VAASLKTKAGEAGAVFGTTCNDLISPVEILASFRSCAKEAVLNIRRGSSSNKSNSALQAMPRLILLSKVVDSTI